MTHSDHVVAMETVSDERLAGIARGIRTRLGAGASGAPDMDRDLVSALSELLASRLDKQGGAETEGGDGVQTGWEKMLRRQAEIFHDYALGNLTRLGVANYLRREGFNSTHAVDTATALHASPSPVGGEPAEVAQKLPQDVITLVIAAREMFDLGYDPDHAEANALDRAIDAFSSRVPYENQPDDECASHSPVLGEPK